MTTTAISLASPPRWPSCCFLFFSHCCGFLGKSAWRKARKQLAIQGVIWAVRSPGRAGVPPGVGGSSAFVASHAELRPRSREPRRDSFWSGWCPLWVVLVEKSMAIPDLPGGFIIYHLFALVFHRVFCRVLCPGMPGTPYQSVQEATFGRERLLWKGVGTFRILLIRKPGERVCLKIEERQNGQLP